MKYLLVSATMVIFLFSCEHGHGQHHGHDPHGHGHSKEFKAVDFNVEKLSKTAVIILNGNIQTVFPLFNPIEEQKWAPVFKPHFIYPADKTIQEGMSFKTAGHGEEDELLWIITKYDTATHLIQYLVSTPNRYWTITVDCREAGDDPNQTTAEITYAYYPLNKKGVDLNKRMLEHMYAKDLKDWEEVINDYLAKH